VLDKERHENRAILKILTELSEPARLNLRHLVVFNLSKSWILQLQLSPS
jgi:hypothetical protein